VDEGTAPQTDVSKNSRIRVAEWGSVVAIGLSALALAIGVYQTRLMQAQARAGVWPYVKIGASYLTRGDNPGFEFHVENNGVGPALVKSVQVSLDDKPLRSWVDAFPVLLGHGESFAKFEGLAGAVIPPSTNRETAIVAIRINDLQQAEKFFDARGRFKVEICYCSVYDECWKAHLLVPKVDEVSACHESKDEFDY
jgi:hypothetical protein